MRVCQTWLDLAQASGRKESQSLYKWKWEVVSAKIKYNQKISCLTAPKKGTAVISEKKMAPAHHLPNDQSKSSRSRSHIHLILSVWKGAPVHGAPPCKMSRHTKTGRAFCHARAPAGVSVLRIHRGSRKVSDSAPLRMVLSCTSDYTGTRDFLAVRSKAIMKGGEGTANCWIPAAKGFSLTTTGLHSSASTLCRKALWYTTNAFVHRRHASTSGFHYAFCLCAY